MNTLRNVKRSAVTEVQKFIKPKKTPCQHLVRPSRLIKDNTGCGNDYIDTFFYCTELRKRITKKHCKDCKLYKAMRYEP